MFRAEMRVGPASSATPLFLELWRERLVQPGTREREKMLRGEKDLRKGNGGGSLVSSHDDHLHSPPRQVLNGDVDDWMHRCMNYVGVELGCLNCIYLCTSKYLDV
jgi:hypothetical protein